MLVKYVGQSQMDFLVSNNYIADLVPGKIYKARVSKKRPESWYVVTDESGEEYAYPKKFFELIEE